ncbi:hypothetical protein ABPG75_002759 [Micractinium tetrahymenae]
MRCPADPAVCERCGVDTRSYNALGLKGGKCVRCQDPSCLDCGADWATCMTCSGPSSYPDDYATALKDGICVRCLEPRPCDPNDTSCDASLDCPGCAWGWGKVGKACQQCQVANCTRCDGDTAKCQECD